MALDIAEVYKEVREFAKNHKTPPIAIMSNDYKLNPILSRPFPIDPKIVFAELPTKGLDQGYSVTIHKSRGKALTTNSFKIDVDKRGIPRIVDLIRITVNGKPHSIQKNKPWFIIVNWLGDRDVPAEISPMMTTYGNYSEAVKRVRAMRSLQNHLGRVIAIHRAIEGGKYEY
jgi:hypothetical protein